MKILPTEVSIGDGLGLSDYYDVTLKFRIHRDSYRSLQRWIKVIRKGNWCKMFLALDKDK